MTDVHLQRFLARLDRRSERLEARSKRLSWLRVGIFSVSALGTILWWETDGRWAPAVLGLVVFLAVVRVHEELARGILRTATLRRIKAMRIARRARDWEALPPAFGVDAGETHAFSADLDIMGARGLHRLLDTSFSTGGARKLASWLLETGSGPAADRQLLVRDLVPRPAFCDRIALESTVFSGPSARRFDGDVLLSWLGASPDARMMRRILAVLWALAAVNVLLVALHIAGLTGPLWAFSLVVYAAVYLMNGRYYNHLFDEAERLHYELEKLRPVLRLLESRRFPRAQALENLLQGIRRDRPSRELRRVMWLAVAASAQKSEILRLVFNVLVPWDLHFASRLERLKDALREELPAWLTTVFTLEAAGSLATYAALNPDASFPDLLADGPGLEATGLGHPLVPREDLVRNDLELTDPGTLAIVTGSNMSGKSTYLRSVGLAVVMARAGGPVDALSLRLSDLRVFTSMGVTDSVTDGISFFYAEVRRLARLMEAVRGAEPGRVLVLIDEIFRGTNNRERLLGSRALIEEVIRRGALGLVATHDLDLVRLTEQHPSARNLHFREDVSGGRMVFDYLLRTGPCPTTNALKIMAMEGLPVVD
ncbi:MAG: hypothetical protein JJ896_14740 [Rhodothermales bacterium]|nr:hypothetical protein [Rhodothermales bacterium]MBO6780909.1 hypothetical protein [Rhodothermales bacterium]